MNSSSSDSLDPDRDVAPAVLATDLDGTLIPLEGQESNRRDLRVLARGLLEREIPLVFVTGRHRASVEQAIGEHGLPEPDSVICDVGTTILERDSRDELGVVEAYRRHQRDLVGEVGREELLECLTDLEELELQEEERQGEFKLSFITDARTLFRTVSRIESRLERDSMPYSIIHSVDPFNGEGLVDLLPRGVSKARALTWWARHRNLQDEQIVFAGDSGNDLAALNSGFRAILVGNAGPDLVEQVRSAPRRLPASRGLCVARGTATSGVLEGCRHFGLLPPI